LGGRDQEDRLSKPAQAINLQDPIWKKTQHKTGMVEWLKLCSTCLASIKLEFKPQYCQKRAGYSFMSNYLDFVFISCHRKRTKRKMVFFLNTTSFSFNFSNSSIPHEKYQAHTAHKPYFTSLDDLNSIVSQPSAYLDMPLELEVQFSSKAHA
jgi:hypothetical protein